MFLVKILHSRHSQDAFIKIFNRVIPNKSPAFFYGRYDCRRVDYVVTNVRHQLSQNNFVYARENFRLDKLA